MNVACNEANKDRRIHNWLLPGIEEESRLMVESDPFQSDKPKRGRPPGNGTRAGASAPRLWAINKK